MQHHSLLSPLAFATVLTVGGGSAGWIAVAADSANAEQRNHGIDLNELRADAEQRFNTADADEDGLVSADEFAAADLSAVFARDREGRRRARAKEGEWAGAGREGVFDAADTDANGQLSEQEFNAVPAAVRSLRQQRLFERFDANADGSLSLAEFPSRLMRLQTLDANADGFVSQDEMPRNWRSRRARR